ncbi:MAG TPA: hypothetical protein PLX85_04820 [Dehalococcoidia bacterium]|nr:hypothetical protein [Dehalococcoidia bacterium]
MCTPGVAVGVAVAVGDGVAASGVPLAVATLVAITVVVAATSSRGGSDGLELVAPPQRTEARTTTSTTSHASVARLLRIRACAALI